MVPGVTLEDLRTSPDALSVVAAAILGGVRSGMTAAECARHALDGLAAWGEARSAEIGDE